LIKDAMVGKTLLRSVGFHLARKIGSRRGSLVSPRRWFFYGGVGSAAGSPVRTEGKTNDPKCLVWATGAIW
jgi:hypothetical protein